MKRLELTSLPTHGMMLPTLLICRRDRSRMPWNPVRGAAGGRARCNLGGEVEELQARCPRAALAWHAGLPDLVALVFLALAALGFFWRVVTGQSWMPADGGDLVSFLYPTYRFAAATLHAGAWPLWDPHVYVGAPHVADIQAGFLYPPNLLLFLLDPVFPYQALQSLSLGHIWFAGAGMYFFLSRSRAGVAGEKHLGRLPALAGALAFMFSDSLLVHFGNLNFDAVVSWMPWVFWAYLAGLEPPPARFDLRRYGRGALAGFLLAVGSLAGHIQATLFIALALAFYTLTWLYSAS